MSIDVNENEFDEKISNAEGVVLVDFWAEWCPPCRALSPLLEELEAEESNVTVVKVNVDDNQALAAQHGIRGIPTVKLYKDGQEIETFVGLLPKDKYKQAIANA